MILFGLLLLAFLSLRYFLEVILGSSLGVYNPAIGFESNCEKIQKLSKKEFFTKLNTVFHHFDLYTIDHVSPLNF